MRALLDVNVLVALLDAGHLHHARAMAWMTGEIGHGWASCPITQNGCLRIMSQPAYPNALPVAAVAERLGEAAADASHEFWPDGHSLLGTGAIDWTRVTGHRQITDAYLLRLAVERGGRFVTFDQRLSLSLVKGAQARHLFVLNG